MYLRNKGKKKKEHQKRKSLHHWNGCPYSNTPLKHMEQFIIWSFSPPAFKSEHVFSTKIKKNWPIHTFWGILYWVGSSSTSTKPQVWGFRPGFTHPLLCGLQAEPAVPPQGLPHTEGTAISRIFTGIAVSV